MWGRSSIVLLLLNTKQHQQQKLYQEQCWLQSNNQSSLSSRGKRSLHWGENAMHMITYLNTHSHQHIHQQHFQEHRDWRGYVQHRIFKVLETDCTTATKTECREVTHMLLAARHLIVEFKFNFFWAQGEKSSWQFCSGSTRRQTAAKRRSSKSVFRWADKKITKKQRGDVFRSLQLQLNSPAWQCDLWDGGHSRVQDNVWATGRWKWRQFFREKMNAYPESHKAFP